MTPAEGLVTRYSEQAWKRLNIHFSSRRDVFDVVSELKPLCCAVNFNAPSKSGNNAKTKLQRSKTDFIVISEVKGVPKQSKEKPIATS